jgi:hypothetical protein
MNVFLWILQILLAVHTLMGALWKLSNPAEQAVPSLQAIPQPLWIGISLLEVFLAIALVVPLFNRKAAILAPISATIIAAIMFIYSGIHLASVEPNNSPIIYWMGVTAVCAFIAWGRFIAYPLRRT